MCKTEKASGPDALSAKILKSCYFSLAPIFCDIFNRCILAGRLCFEHIVKDRLLTFTSLEETRFSYKQKVSTKDACPSLDYFLR